MKGPKRESASWSTFSPAWRCIFGFAENARLERGFIKFAVIEASRGIEVAEVGRYAEAAQKNRARDIESSGETTSHKVAAENAHVAEVGRYAEAAQKNRARDIESSGETTSHKVAAENAHDNDGTQEQADEGDSEPVLQGDP